MMESSFSINKLKSWLMYAFAFIAFVSPNMWSSVPLFNSQVERLVQYLILFLLLVYISKLKKWKKYKVVFWFGICALVGIFRGIFAADCYWEYNQLTIGVMCLSLPLFVYLFDNPTFSLRFNRMWLRWCMLAFFLFFLWTCGPTQFYLSPLFFFALFFFEIPKKWRFLIGLCLFMMALQLGSRAQVMKVAVSLCFALAYWFRKYISVAYLRILHWAFYGIAILLLFLGIMGYYNFFSDGVAGGGDRTGKYEYAGSGSTETEDLASDTRTFIYNEVITSALSHDYVLLGRTPALGNDSFFFDDINKNYPKQIRFMNELCHTNIFTWLGFVGLVLYALIYLRASWLAVYRSRSFALKIIGCYIAFHWMFGWIEDMNRFDISNISMWVVFAMGFSPAFREMSEQQFMLWFKSIFRKNESTMVC